MSSERAGAWLLLFCAAAFFAGPQASDAGWLAAGLAPWALALASPPELPWRPALAVWAAWLGWLGACAIASPEPWLSLGDWWRTASAVFCLGLAAAWWSRRQRRWWALGLATIGGAVALAGGVARALAPAVLPRLGAWTVWAAAAPAAAAGWLAGETDDGIRLPAWLALVGAGAACAFSGSWPARLALAVAAAFCALAGSRRSGGAALLLLLAAGAWLDRASWSAWNPGRAWSEGFGALCLHPIVGVGPGRLERFFLGQTGEALASRSYVLRSGAEAGAAGLLLLLAAAGASIPRGFRRLDAASRSAAAAFLAFFAWLMLEDASAGPALTVALATSAAITLSAGRFGEGRAADRGAPLRLQRWFTAIGLVLCLLAWWPRRLLRLARSQSAAVPAPAQREAALERVLAIAPADDVAHAGLAVELVGERPPRVGEALLEIERAHEEAPANAVYLGRIAQLWASMGDAARASAAAEEALRQRERLRAVGADPALWAWDAGTERQLQQLSKPHAGR